MKITFFKNESHFYPRVSYAYENAQNVDERVKNPDFIKKILPLLRKILPYLFTTLWLVYTYLFAKQLAQKSWLVVAILVLTLPLHEFCHAIYCWLSGRKVERICFFSYKNDFMGKYPIAYIKEAFGAWRKHQAIMLGLFPLILLTGVPVILSIWLSEFRIWLIWLALYNLSTSALDICGCIMLAFMPKEGVWFGSFGLMQCDDAKPIVLHELSITAECKTIRHRQFTYDKGELTEVDIPEETPSVLYLRQEFIDQFNLNEQERT